MFSGRSNVEFCGGTKFPVSKCRFHFERVETLVFSCVVISSRYVEALRLFTLLPVLLIPGQFVLLEDFSVIIGVKVRVLLNCTHFSFQASCKFIDGQSPIYICMNFATYACRFLVEK